jgi:hypothetical protein
MGKKKSPSLPDAPTFFKDPRIDPSLDELLSFGQGLTRGDFLNAGDETVGFLNPLVSLNPEITQQAISLALSPLEVAQDRARQNTLNQLAANNQLQSSVTADALSQLEQGFSRDVGNISSGFALADAERALANIGNLSSLGVSTLGNVNQLAQANQAQRNEFNLSNFPNQVAVAQSRAKRGGGLGGAIGTGIGALAGAFIPGVGPLVGAGIGGALGGGIDSGGGFGSVAPTLLNASQLLPSFGGSSGGSSGFTPVTPTIRRGKVLTGTDFERGLDPLVLGSFGQSALLRSGGLV